MVVFFLVGVEIVSGLVLFSSVEGGGSTDWGTELTRIAAAAQPELMAAALAQIAFWAD